MTPKSSNLGDSLTPAAHITVFCINIPKSYSKSTKTKILETGRKRTIASRCDLHHTLAGHLNFDNLVVLMKKFSIWLISFVQPSFGISSKFKFTKIEKIKIIDWFTRKGRFVWGTEAVGVRALVIQTFKIFILFTPWTFFWNFEILNL